MSNAKLLAYIDRTFPPVVVKITMLETRRGSGDGFALHRFHKGETLVVGKGIHESLAFFFVRNGYARKDAVSTPSLSTATVRQHIPNQAAKDFSVGKAMREIRNED